MPYIPPHLRKDDITEQIARFLPLYNHGKVRDTFKLTQRSNDSGERLLLVVASNRISTHDFVLGSTIPYKGAALTRINAYWCHLLERVCPQDLVAYGSLIDEYLPPKLHNNPELQARALVVKQLSMVSVECVVRGYLTGSGWAAYVADDGVVCGHQLPPGLHDGSKLDVPIFTPTTKEKKGHDLPLDYREVKRKFGNNLEDLSIKLFTKASDELAAKGIILADTKFEFGNNSQDEIVLADERITPDSSRLWKQSDWEASQAQEAPRSPRGMDKQAIRNFTAQVETPFTKNAVPIDGLGNLNPKLVKHQEFAGSIHLPPDIVDATSRDYRAAVTVIVGRPLKMPY